MPLGPGSRADITGLILCGGLGRRMSLHGEGTEKALVPFRGRPLIHHVIDRLHPQVGGIVLNTRSDRAPWPAFGWPLVRDLVEGFAGPLAGLQAGLAVCTSDWLLMVPCDTPLLPLDLVERLALAQRQTGAERLSVRCGDQAHPVFALVHRRAAADLDDFLASGGRKIDAWLARGPWQAVDFPDASAFVNLNTMDELSRLEHHA